MKNNKNYIPDKIIAKNQYCAEDYRKKISKVPIQINKKIKFRNNKLVDQIKINKKSSNIIVFPGIHDVRDIYFFLRNSKTLDKYKYFFKLHPKNKFLFQNSKKIKIVNDYKKKFFSKVIISQTSSLVYDFLRVNKKFFIIDFDYKLGLLNKNISKKIKFINKF